MVNHQSMDYQAQTPPPERQEEGGGGVQEDCAGFSLSGPVQNIEARTEKDDAVCDLSSWLTQASP